MRVKNLNNNDINSAYRYIFFSIYGKNTQNMSIKR